MKKLLVILGPTASGKSDLAVDLALKLNGEVISADSRQVYKGLDIGTGKITVPEMKGVPHHLLDVVEPNTRFTVEDWRNLAEKAIEEIASRGKLPIICGGTGFYIDSLLNGTRFPDIEEDPETKSDLVQKTTEELFQELEILDPRRASDMKTNGDYKNKRRVIRAILIAKKLGTVPPLSSGEAKPRWLALKIGISIPDAELKARIRSRLIRRLDSGMVEEAKWLLEPPPNGASLSYERLDELGLEYRYLAKLIKVELTRDQFVETLSAKIWQYARRQKTWWKRDMEIHWYAPRSFADIIVDHFKKDRVPFGNAM